jgi:hypothetical protein
VIANPAIAFKPCFEVISNYLCTNVKTMKLKENIKSKVDTLNPNDLRLVQMLIDSLSDKGKVKTGQPSDTKQIYLEIIKLMKPAQLTSYDIDSGRSERI